MKLMVLDKNGKWKTHNDKVDEESTELIEAIKEGNILHIAEAVHTHNGKLVNRGWKHKTVIKVQVNKK